MFFAIIALSVALLASPAVGCPPAEDIAPLCDCRKWGGEFVMTCHDVLAPKQLIAPMESLSTRKSNVSSIKIEDSNLEYIPHGLFEGTSIEKIWIHRSEVKSLSDSDVAFSGLEKTLTEIRVTEAQSAASWDWKQLRNLQNLELVDFHQITMETLDDPFPRLPGLEALGITNAGLTHLVDGAFAELPYLRILDLRNNRLLELEKNVLPDPAERLFVLDLSHNLLSYLPEDFFLSMPNIHTVRLDKNNFVTLPKETFSRAFRYLTELSIAENPLQCDCRMLWIVYHGTPTQFTATCEKPQSLKGRSPATLKSKDFSC